MSELQPNFFELLESRVKEIDSHLCVGLDPHDSELNLEPGASEQDKSESAYSFCKRIIDASSEFVLALGR